MIIKQLTANFGGLINRELFLEPGLNVIFGPNESGKSTWLAFIGAMLYGINTSDRDKKGYLAPKTRFMPWQGRAMEGRMNISCKDGEITIQRSALGAAPMKRFEAFYTGTGEPAHHLTGENAGEYLIGVPEMVFIRSAYISQSGIMIGQTAQLEKRISALVSTGEESLSYTETAERLAAWRRRLRHNQHGTLPRLEEEARNIQGMLYKLEKKNEGLAKLRLEVEALKRDEFFWEQELEEHKRLLETETQKQVEETNRRIRQTEEVCACLEEMAAVNGRVPAAEEFQEAHTLLGKTQSQVVCCGRLKNETERLKNLLKPLEYELKANVFFGLDPEQAMQKAREKIREIETLNSEKKLVLIPAIVLLSLCLCAAGFGLFKFGLLFNILAGVFGAAAVGAFAFAVGKNRRDTKQKRLQEREILDSMKADNPEAIIRHAEAYKELFAKNQRSEAEIEKAELEACASEKELRRLEANLEETVFALIPDYDETTDVLLALTQSAENRRRLFEMRTRLDGERKVLHTLLQSKEAGKSAEMNGLSHKNHSPKNSDTLAKPSLSKKETEDALEECRRKRLTLSVELGRAEGEMRAMGDPVVLGTRLSAIDEELRRQETEYEAVKLSEAILEESNTELQTRFSPQLARRAAEIMNEMTGGRYSRISLDKDLEAMAGVSGETVDRSSLFFSRGTIDQLYLSLRLAISELVLPENPPLLLDEALASFDRERCEAALSWLRREAENRQILLFTCHEREAAYFQDDKKVTVIRLDGPAAADHLRD